MLMSSSDRYISNNNWIDFIKVSYDDYFHWWRLNAFTSLLNALTMRVIIFRHLCDSESLSNAS